jgi:hypothetical protein
LYNNGDNGGFGGEAGSAGVFGKRWGRRCLELLVDALSGEEWSYVLGLFFADGWCSVTKYRRGVGSRYPVGFDLQGGEGELAYKLIALLRRAGLNPRKVTGRQGKDMIEVVMASKPFLYFLPDKKNLSDNAVARRAFFERNKLYDIRFGIPFLAGLLDGDGSCSVRVQNDSCFGSVAT